MFSRQKKVMCGIRRTSFLIVSIFFFKINEVSFITIVLLEQGCQKCAKLVLPEQRCQTCSKLGTIYHTCSKYGSYIPNLQ